MGKIEKRKVWMGLIMVPPVILLIVLFPPVVLYLMVFLATFLGLREYTHLVLPNSNWMERTVGIGLGLMLSVIVSFGGIKQIHPFLVVALLILSVFFMGTSKDLSSTISKMGMVLFGILFIGFLLTYVSLMRNMPRGRLWVLFLTTTVWAGDISALVTGASFGKHKLYPKISPQKTFEGLGGAILGSMIVALVFVLLFLPQVKKETCILLAAGIGFFGQLGDFTESMLKRSASVKDSGNLIPGHGGMLDRLDSFLFSAPFLYYCLLYLLKETP